MIGRNAISVLVELCELDPPEITGQGIELSGDRQSIEDLVVRGALVPTGNSNTVLCLGCENPHSITVEHVAGDQYRAYCVDSGYQAVRSDDIRVFTVDDSWMASAVRAALNLRPIVDDASHAILNIGQARFHRYRCGLFFASRLSDLARFSEIKQRIRQLTGSSAAVLLTSTPYDQIAGEPPPRCAIVALDDVLSIGPNQIELNERPILAVLRGADRPSRSDGIGFEFSIGFRSVSFDDQHYTFSDKQALVIEALYEAWRTGNPRLHQSEIQGLADTSQRVGQLFARHPAYLTLIKHDNAGYYWLDL